MSLVTPEKLTAAGLADSATAQAVAAALDAACARFGITSGPRLAGFLSQCAHESGGFKMTQENLNYSGERLAQVFPRMFSSSDAAAPYSHQPEKIACRIYGGRMGNGPEASGDGWRFRGRGFIQLTGRENYTRFAAAIGTPGLDPDLVASPTHAALSAAWFWASHGMNELADKDSAAVLRALQDQSPCLVLRDPSALAEVEEEVEVRDETKRINGGVLGLDERQRLFDAAARVFV